MDVPRQPLPAERHGITRRFEFGGYHFYATANASEDRATGELFIRGIALGDALGGALDAWALSFSLAWQHGAPLRLLVDKHARARYGPEGFTGDPSLGHASSPSDAVCRWLGQRFLGDAGASLPPPQSPPDPPHADGPPVQWVLMGEWSITKARKALLIARATGLEVRFALEDPAWDGFWRCIHSMQTLDVGPFDAWRKEQGNEAMFDGCKVVRRSAASLPPPHEGGDDGR